MDTQVSKPAIVEVPLTVSETPLEEAPPASPATPIEQNKLTLKWVNIPGQRNRLSDDLETANPV